MTAPLHGNPQTLVSLRISPYKKGRKKKDISDRLPYYTEARRGGRTRNLEIKSLTLCRLS